MNAPIASRREFLVGFAACLALLFAPFERFFEGLRAMCASVYEASAPRISATYADLAAILKAKYSQPRLYSVMYGNNPWPGAR
jgi:hypothetical protein